MKKKSFEFISQLFDELEKLFPTIGNHFIKKKNGKLYVWISHNQGRFQSHTPFEIVEDQEDDEMTPKELAEALKAAFLKMQAQQQSSRAESKTVAGVKKVDQSKVIKSGPIKGNPESKSQLSKTKKKGGNK